MVSMALSLKIILILGSGFVLFYVIYNAIKSKMNIRYAILWISWSLIVLLLGIFPGAAEFFSRLIGIESVTNFVFLVMIALLFVFNYYTYVKMSTLEEHDKKLNYELAVTKKKLEEYEKKQ